MTLSGVALRQMVGGIARAYKLPLGDGAVDAVCGYFAERFKDHSRPILESLERSNLRAWKSLEIALAGDSLWQRAKDVVRSTADDMALQADLRQFIQSAPLPGLDAAGRAACVDEIRSARKAGLLTEPLNGNELARQAGHFARFVSLQAVFDAQWRIVEAVADALPEDRYPHLRKLLRARAGPDQSSLLAVAVTFFFRREIESDDALARAFAWESGQHLAQSLEDGFAAVEVAFERHAGQLDQLLDLSSATFDEVRALRVDMEALGRQLNLTHTRLRSHDTFSIRTEHERHLVRAVLDRFRALPASSQQDADLLNRLGLLEVAAGELAPGQALFEQAAAAATDDAGRALGHYNAYRAARERRDWPAALDALTKAVAADPVSFTPFPLAKYRPLGVLGAGGFGTAFLCEHQYLRTKLVVKSLEPDGLQRDVSDIFHEARVLSDLRDPVIIGLIDCDYADAGQKRPYLAMEYFDGPNLEDYVRRHAPLPVEQAVQVARLLCQALAAAHARGVWHRDVKPRNVLVRNDGEGMRVKLIDFGLAMRQRGGDAATNAQSLVGSSTVGTMDYAAPEQLGKLEGVSTGPYSDIYGFARTCCYALFRTPHPTPQQWRKCPEAVADLLGECLAEDPQERPADFSTVLRRLSETTRAAESPAPPPPAKTASASVFTNTLDMKFVPIQPGSFLMGSPASEESRSNDETRHKVVLTKPFYLGATEVTQAQWKAVMGSNPSSFKGDDLPVEQVSWEDAVEFCKKLSESERRHYRLPTEAEWEYACRAGTTTPFHTGETISTDQANYNGDYTYGTGRKGVYREKTSPVGSFAPNAWGLHDMHGNVWEWCADWYDSYPAGDATDPTGPANPPAADKAWRVLRGGSWIIDPPYCRAAVRGRNSPDFRYNDFGFRLCLDFE